MAGVSYSVYWADGTPDGLWLATRAGWTGIALVCPKTGWPNARNRPEFSHAGVYVLVTAAPNGGEEVYIGEADILRNRLNNHYAGREWSRAVAFTTSDGSLNKAHVKHLESALIALAQKAGRAAVLNDKPSLAPQLSEVETANVENFLSDMLPIYRLVGLIAFTPISESVKAAAAGGSGTMYWLKAGVAQARGQELPEGFVVHEGTAALSATPALGKASAERRISLMEAGALVPEGDHLRLAAPQTFGSPSAAASILAGFNLNGLVYWKDATGVSLKDRQKAQASG